MKPSFVEKEKECQKLKYEFIFFMKKFLQWFHMDFDQSLTIIHISDDHYKYLSSKIYFTKKSCPFN